MTQTQRFGTIQQARQVSRRGFLATTGGLIGAAAFGPTALARATTATRLGAGTYFPWVQVGKGIHAAIDLSSGGNVMVATGTSAAVMVDTKFPAFAAALKREAESFGSTVTHVINTHHHADHTGGNGVLKGEVDVLMAHKKAAARIESQLERYVGAARGGPRQIDPERDSFETVLEEAQAAAEQSEGWTAKDFVPDALITSDREELTVDNIDLVLYHFGPAHTDNDVIVHAVEANVLHTGDLCFNGLHPFFDSTAGVTCRGWSDVLGKVIELCDNDTVVVPGHGDITDRDGLKTQQQYMDQLWEHVAAEVAKGTAKADVEAMSWSFMDGLGFEQIRSRAIGVVYDEVTAAGG